MAIGIVRLAELLAALSHQADLPVGCYCEEERRCHRSIVREALREAGAAPACVRPARRTP
jgi:uncharacterized protein YeaO (DUF488 family)